MAFGDVSEFVRDDACEFFRRFDVAEKTGEDEDVSAESGKGVDLVVVDEADVEFSDINVFVVAESGDGIEARDHFIESFLGFVVSCFTKIGPVKGIDFFGDLLFDGMGDQAD